MPDVTFYNYPYNQYVFTSSELKRVLLRQQGCDEWSRRPGPGYGAGGLYGAGYGNYGGGCCGAAAAQPYPCGPLNYPFVYQ
jgi:hypothetical protein